RKLMQQGGRPFAVCLFFSLGHSAVVILMSAAVAFATSEVTSRFESLKDIGSIISTSASAAFLFLLALMNFIVLLSV
ncbi:HoxN/HupN/NixA family nickel/cobalt transporter, partial [Klebsiella pneumoniae]